MKTNPWSTLSDAVGAGHPHLMVWWDAEGFPTVHGLRCRTCGGEVGITIRRAPSARGFELRASCHGMWRVDVGELTVEFLGDFFSRATSIPEKVPEYYVDYEVPAVSEHRRFHVSKRTARAARIGSDMQIEGVRGMVHGIDTRRHEITLGPLAEPNQEKP